MKSDTGRGGVEGRRSAVRLSVNAEAVLQSRYLRRNERGEAIERPEDMFRRVASAVASAERTFGAADADLRQVRSEFYQAMAELKFLPNSPTLMNAGRDTGLLSACFVLPVDDSIHGIFSSIKQAAMIQKAGGGTGFSFSRLRPRGDRVTSTGGTTSGPVSFMGVFAAATDAIQQGAFRRGANMAVLRIDHADIIEFVDAKSSTDTLTNFNLSVAVTDQFMRSLREDPGRPHVVVNPRNGQASELPRRDGSPWLVSDVFDHIVSRAWGTGEPGIVFIDRMDDANPTPQKGRIEATNPCGEQPLLPFESCDLGSINLAKLIEATADGATIDFEGFRRAIRLATRFLDDVIEISKYPVLEIEQVSTGNRKIGLGVMGFADALYALGIPYDSDEGIAMGEQIMQCLNEVSHQTSAELAGKRGTFPYWEGSLWQKRNIRMRNAATSTVAPTGTISIIAGCSGGIEPVFSLAFTRNILDGQRLVEVNPVFERVAREQGFYSDDLIARIAGGDSVQELPGIPDDVKRVFVTAHDIAPEWHVRMQAAFQKHCDAAISKTINFPNSAMQDDVRNAFLLAHELGCKGITVYRDGCRPGQPMATGPEATTSGPPELATPVARPARLPEIMPAIRVRQATPFGNMHVKIVVDPGTGKEMEVFAQLGKGGDLANSDLEAICRLISLYLRVDGDLTEIVGQLSGIGSSLSIPTKDGRITSLADGLAAALQEYRQAKETSGLPALLLGKALLPHSGDTPSSTSTRCQPTKQPGGAESFRIKCPACGSDLTFQEGCVKCQACGFAQC